MEGIERAIALPDTSQCIEERDADAGDRVLRQYVWGLYVDELIQQREFPYEDLPERSCDYYPLSDLHYRTVALSDAAGCIAEAYDTDAYGRTLVSRDCRDGALDIWAFHWPAQLECACAASSGTREGD